MPKSPNQHESSAPQPDQARDFLVQHMDVSPDVSIATASGLLTAFASGVAERGRVIGRTTSDAAVYARYEDLKREGTLPVHLQRPDVFAQRYRQLVGIGSDDLSSTEVVNTVRANRHLAPKQELGHIERGLARMLVEMNHMDLYANPVYVNTISWNTTVSVERTDHGAQIVTGDELSQPLPRKHAGVVYAAPVINDAFGMAVAMRDGIWDNGVLLQTTQFSEEYNRGAAVKLFGISPKRVLAYGDGLSDGVDRLQQEMPKNKRIKQGFGAVIIANVERVAIEEIDAVIDAAPALLAPHGALILSGHDRFQDGKGSIFHYMDRARKAFGHDAEKIGLMTVEDIQDVGFLAISAAEGSGRQASFVKK